MSSGKKHPIEKPNESDEAAGRQVSETVCIPATPGDIRIDPDTQHCFKTPRVGQIRNDGQFRIIWNASEPIRPEPYPASRTAEDWKALLHDLYTEWGNQWTSPPTD